MNWELKILTECKQRERTRHQYATIDFWRKFKKLWVEIPKYFYFFIFYFLFFFIWPSYTNIRTPCFFDIITTQIKMYIVCNWLSLNKLLNWTELNLKNTGHLRPPKKKEIKNALFLVKILEKANHMTVKVKMSQWESSVQHMEGRSLILDLSLHLICLMFQSRKHACPRVNWVNRNTFLIIK